MPQFRDEHMQTPGIEETVISPKFQQNVLRIDHLIPVLTKPFQYFRLAVGEFLSHSGMQQCLRDRIEQITSYFKTAGNLCLREAERFSHQRLDTYDQFLHAERLFQIIVCSEFESFYHIVDGRTGSQKQYRCLFVRLPDATYHFEAVHFGHHHIGHQHVRPKFKEKMQSFFAVGSGMDGKTVFLERIFDNHGECQFVFHQQYCNVVFAHVFDVLDSNGKCTSFAGFTFDGDGASMFFDHAFDIEKS